MPRFKIKKKGLLEIWMKFYSDKAPYVIEVDEYGGYKSQPHAEVEKDMNAQGRTFQTYIFKSGIYRFKRFNIYKADYRLYTIFNGVSDGYFELKTNGECKLIDFKPLPKPEQSEVPRENNSESKN